MRLPYHGDPHSWGLLYFQTLGAEPLPGGTWENYHLGPYLPESLCALQDFVQRVERISQACGALRVWRVERGQFKKENPHFAVEPLGKRLEVSQLAHQCSVSIPA